ncbi:MAG: ATP-binding protein [Mariprofundaceae bacterium]
MLWPSIMNPATMLIASINIILMFLLSLFLIIYGIRTLREKQEKRAGSNLRAKLVTALVGMLLIPTMTLHLAANQMVGRSMDIWFDVRVDTLLDQALNLAQGFYARIDNDLKQGLTTAMNDTELLSLAAEFPLSYSTMVGRLNEIMQREAWHSIHIFDLNERLVTGVQAQGLSTLESGSLSEAAKLAMTLDRVTTEFSTLEGDELAIGYAPLRAHQNIIGLLRVQIQLPTDVVQNARAVEADYRTYRELERNRLNIADRFTHIMLLITLIIITAASMIAITFARKLTSPISDMAIALQRVTDGDLSVSIPSAPKDELGSLVHSFNRMTQYLRQNTEALEQAQTDLTDALNSSRQRQYVMEKLLASLQSGVLLTNDHGEIRLMNQAFRHLLQMKKKDFPIGSNMANMGGRRLHKIGQFFDELMHQQGQLQREIELSSNHSKLQILARGTHLKQTDSSGFSGYLVVLDDISGLAEAQRHRAWAEVAQRLAHEIKNPLTPIKLSAERLQRRFRDQVDNTMVFDSCTHAIIGQVERLQRLISDFSTLARMPKPHLENIAVSKIVTDMHDLYAPYRRAKVEHLAGNIDCQCDPDQIRQILINLMDNAISATESEQKNVHLYSDIQDQWIELHVKDEGEGIPNEVRSHIFDAYYSTKDDGSGLGLAIAKRIADEHNGILQLLSSASPTHFCLRLPQQTSSMEQS